MKTTKQASSTFNHWIYDTRVIQRNIHDGIMTNADYKAFLEALPDISTKSEALHTSKPGQEADALDALDGDDADDLDEQE